MNAPAQSKDLVTTFKNQVATRESDFRMALPPHIPAERFMRVVNTAVTGNPDLLHADRVSLFQSAMRAAQDGLLPDGRDGALVIYNTNAAKKGQPPKWEKRVQWMPMIGGILKRIRNSGELSSITAHVAYERDAFTYVLGDDEKIEHKPALEERGKPRLVYAIAKTKDGGIYREIMTVADVDKVRKKSKNAESGPWVEWWEEMAKKTVLRRMSKRLPTSADLDDLVRRDDELYEFDKARAASGSAPAGGSLGERLAALGADAPYDPETGEIIEHETGADVGGHSASTGHGEGDIDKALDEPNAVAATPEDAQEIVLSAARTATMDGRKAFDSYYRSLDDAQRDLLNGHVKGLLEAADKADGGK
jgi:recombination protein RecT